MIRSARTIRMHSLLPAGAMALGTIAMLPASAQAMHISEGILPASWAGIWFVLAVPMVMWGLWTIKRRSQAQPKYKALVALVGSAIFVISCMPIPIPWTGTCSHPCGTGLGAILIGPGPTIVVASISLLLQALFLAHGGLTTLGANITSMGIAGALAGYGIFHGLRICRVPVLLAAFAAGVLSDWATYTVTSGELAWALHGNEGFWPLMTSIAIAFAPTQIPLGILEGFLTAGAYKFLQTRRPELLATHPAEGGSA